LGGNWRKAKKGEPNKGFAAQPRASVSDGVIVVKPLRLGIQPMHAPSVPVMVSRRSIAISFFLKIFVFS